MNRFLFELWNNRFDRHLPPILPNYASQVSIINYAGNSSSCNWAIWKILSGLSSYINEQFISFVISCLFLLSFFAWNCISFYFIISNEHYVRRTFKNMVERKIWEFIEFCTTCISSEKKNINSSSIFLINPIDFITSISKIDKTISTMS